MGFFDGTTHGSPSSSRCFSLALIAPVASAQLPDDPLFEAKTLNSFEEAATFTATFVPAKAKPGEPVTLKLTISPNIGCWTYPGNPRMGQTGTNTFILPKEGDVFFLPKFDDPPEHKVKKTRRLVLSRGSHLVFQSGRQSRMPKRG